MTKISIWRDVVSNDFIDKFSTKEPDKLSRVLSQKFIFQRISSLPLEIQDKIFLKLDYDILYCTRNLQSDFIKKKTKHRPRNSDPDTAWDWCFLSKNSNITWIDMSINPDITWNLPRHLISN